MKQWMLVGLMILSAMAAVAQPAAGSFVDVDGGKLYYEECRTGSKAVLLVHDGVLDSNAWSDVWPALCKQYHVIRYDRRGYGRSPVATKPYYEADDVAALLHARRIERVALVASSHGGELAMAVALRYPELVSHLVLVGAAASGFPYSAHFLLRGEKLGKGKADEQIASATNDPYLTAPGSEAARKRMHEILTATPQDLTHEDMNLPEAAVLPRAHEIKVPTLILVGSADIPDVQAIAGALVTQIPGAVRIVVPDTGHLMYLEKPEEFERQVMGFLQLHGF